MVAARPRPSLPTGCGTGSAPPAVGLRMFRDEVAQGKAEAETDLRERLGLVPHGVPELGRRGRLDCGADKH